MNWKSFTNPLSPEQSVFVGLHAFVGIMAMMMVSVFGTAVTLG